MVDPRRRPDGQAGIRVEPADALLPGRVVAVGDVEDCPHALPHLLGVGWPAARPQPVGPFHRQVAAIPPPVFRHIAGDVRQLHAHAERRGAGEITAILEAQDRTQQQADRPGDLKAIAQEVLLVEASRRREVRPHSIEQGQSRLERQVVPADELRQPAALGGDRAFAGGDPPHVLSGQVDELKRRLWRGGGIHAVVAPPTPGIETLDVSAFRSGQQPAGK